MSFYIRYVLTDDRDVTVEELEQALRQVAPAYAIEGDLISRGGAGYGMIDITHRGDPICDGDLDLLARLGGEEKAPGRDPGRSSRREGHGVRPAGEQLGDRNG